MAEPIEMSFEMWTRVGPRKHVLDGVHLGATWQINTIELSMCGCIAVFLLITVTTCCLFLLLFRFNSIKYMALR